MNAAAFDVRSADWTIDRDRLEAVRRAVFVVEQAVPEALEWDEFDAVSRHALAVAHDGTAIGTARLLPDGHIGRVAVLAPWRRRGVGAALLEHMLVAARLAGCPEVRLNAQVRAVGFYRQFGFVAEGEVFDDAGIEHRAMRLALAPAGPLPRVPPPVGGGDRRKPGGDHLAPAGPLPRVPPPVGGGDRRKPGGDHLAPAGPLPRVPPPVGGGERRKPGGHLAGIDPQRNRDA